jgi:hypothetical protein
MRYTVLGKVNHDGGNDTITPDGIINFSSWDRFTYFYEQMLPRKCLIVKIFK